MSCTNECNKAGPPRSHLGSLAAPGHVRRMSRVRRSWILRQSIAAMTSHRADLEQSGTRYRVSASGGLGSRAASFGSFENRFELNRCVEREARDSNNGARGHLLFSEDVAQEF